MSVDSVRCPTGGDCPRPCDRRADGCFQIWGPADEHLDALRMNAEHRQQTGS